MPDTVANVKQRICEVTDERKRHPLRRGIWKQRGLCAPKHLFSETKGGLNIPTHIFAERRLNSVSKTERKAQKKSVTLAQSPTGSCGNSSGGKPISKVRVQLSTSLRSWP